MNNEAKVRRSTKSVILGKVKVLSYEDIEKVRAKRAAKEEAIVGKGKRGRKRKSAEEEVGGLRDLLLYSRELALVAMEQELQ